MATVQTSMLTYLRQSGILINEEEEVKPHGYIEEVDFVVTYHEDIEMMKEYPEAPESFNGDYISPNFTVLHTIVGNVDGDNNVGFGRSTHHFVDVGIPDKVLVISFSWGIVGSNEYIITDYELLSDTYFLLPKGNYLNYLLSVENEEDMI